MPGPCGRDGHASHLRACATFAAHAGARAVRAGGAALLLCSTCDDMPRCPRHGTHGAAPPPVTEGRASPSGRLRRDGRLHTCGRAGPVVHRAVNPSGRPLRGAGMPGRVRVGAHARGMGVGVPRVRQGVGPAAPRALRRARRPAHEHDRYAAARSRHGAVPRA